MSKNEFLNRLYQQLQGLDQNEIDSIMYDYEEHFEMGLYDGKSESQIVSELGSPEKIAKELRTTTIVRKAENTPNTQNIMQAVMATLGLGFLNLFFMIPVIFSYIGMLISLIFIAATFLLSPIIFGLDYFINGADAVSTFEIFMTIALFGLGLIAIPVISFIIKLSNKLLMSYIRWNINTVKGVR
ncbi:DUF1700 domain-containing protein [Macrococcus capreoli]|uniref:DUF1700 domain-containing protein n=1 Tax=Macrococcus capreoli TaxID=2982690 RepID=UPI0021D5B2DD|nr:DUF1700 domain-containing protein [Macrococcus sp. TMW 2.2395]MCU7558203.1 DUF1700 domain-containing protein [Macrococcus sp. TMW 2.2395]